MRLLDLSEPGNWGNLACSNAGRPLGYIICQTRGRVIRVDSIAVVHGVRGRGVGTALMQTITRRLGHDRRCITVQAGDRIGSFLFNCGFEPMSRGIWICREDVLSA